MQINLKLLERFYLDSPEHIRSYVLLDTTYIDVNDEFQTIAFDVSAYEKLNYLDNLQATLLKYTTYFSLLLGFLLLVFFIYSFDSAKVTPYIRLQNRDLKAEFTKYRRMMLYVLLINIFIVWIFTALAIKI